MTILVLILFLLLLSTLISYAILTISYNTIDQNLDLSEGSLVNLRTLSASGSTFANASLSTALVTLAKYEYNASMRKSNFINNTAVFLEYLITNGILPGVAPGSTAGRYLLKSMGSLTLITYNSYLSNTLGTAATSLVINESNVSVFQSSPTSLSVTYIENLLMNSSSGTYRYNIPINATISLNGTPDLLSYELGIPENIKFGDTTNLTVSLGGTSAINGVGTGYIYGIVATVPKHSHVRDHRKQRTGRFQQRAFQLLHNNFNDKCLRHNWRRLHCSKLVRRAYNGERSDAIINYGSMAPISYHQNHPLRKHNNRTADPIGSTVAFNLQHTESDKCSRQWLLFLFAFCPILSYQSAGFLHPAFFLWNFYIFRLQPSRCDLQRFRKNNSYSAHNQHCCWRL